MVQEVLYFPNHYVYNQDIIKTKMKNTTLLFIVAIIIITAFLVISKGGKDQTIDYVSDSNPNPGSEVQKVIISAKDLNYYPSTIKLKSGVPVSLSLDEKVKGCLRSFTIKSLGISKYLKTTEDSLDFTPKNKGTFAFACSMGMGYGKLIVE